MLAKCCGIGCFIANSLIILLVLLSNGQAFARKHKASDEYSSASQQVERKLRLDGTDYLITSSAGFSRPRDLSKIDALNPAICGKTPAFEGHNGKPPQFECPPAGNRRGRRGRKGSDEWAHRYSDGYNATLGEIPFFVALKIRIPAGDHNFEYRVCGGVLISPDYVLTAGHCVDKGLDLIEATAGMVAHKDKKRAQTVSVRGWCRLGEFGISEDGGLSNDIAVLQLAEKFKYNQHVQPACLDYKRRQIKGSVCLGAGMGMTDWATDSPTLVAMPLRDGCDWMNSDVHARTCYEVAPESGFKGQPCRGDSGSGIYCVDRCAGKGARLYAVALVSFGIDGCVQSLPPIPTSFSDLNKMADRLEPLLDQCYESMS